MFLALVLLIIGIFFLLKAMGWVTEEIWAFIWPCVLIVISLAMIFKRKIRNPFWWDVGNVREFRRKFKDND